MHDSFVCAFPDELDFHVLVCVLLIVQNGSNILSAYDVDECFRSLHACDKDGDFSYTCQEGYA